MADPIRKAQKLEKKGEYRRAAEIYLSLGDSNRAIELYKACGDTGRAGELLIENNRADEAIELFMQKGNLNRALDILKQQGNFFKAAMVCKQKHRYREAAAFYEKCGLISESARMLMEEKDYRRAGEYFFRSNMYQSAAEAFELAAREMDQKQNPFAPQTHQTEDTVQRALWIKAANSWEKVPNPEKSAKIYQDLLEWITAAKLYEQVGNFRKALFCYEQADDKKNTIRLLRNLNLHEKADRLMAIESELSGDHLTAARLALQYNDYARAAEYFEKAGKHKLAAENYEKAQAFMLAAEAYFRADEIEKAARMYQASGNIDTAAQLFEQLNFTSEAVKLHVHSQNYTRAAELLLDSDKTEEALRLLLRVPDEHPSQRTIRRLKAIAYFRLKKIETGYNLVKDLLEQPVSTDNIDIYYEYASALQEDGALEQALTTYQKIVDYDRSYREALKYLNWCAAMEETISAKVSDTIVGELPIGMVLAGRYELLELLGKGGMGVVYRAADRELNLAVALKILRPKLSYDPDFIEMFKREVTLARMLAHPNIIKIYDLNRVGNLWFVSMEYLMGEEVKDVILREDRLTSERVIHIGRQILAALDHSHGKQLIHSDIKPQNIFIDSEDHATLVDFGIARTMTQQVRDQTVYGTPGYISPEQITGNPATPRSDIYSLGVTLYEMVTGEMPFEDETMDLILENQLKRIPPPPSTISSEVPSWMDKVIGRMMARKPSDRYESARTVLADFPLE
ncbi:MAG TPA: protein kinase [bacterium]|nr:protein kinase [bacterium]